MARPDARALFRFIALAVASGYVATAFSAGFAVLGGWLITHGAGLHGYSAAAVFTGAALVMFSLASVAVNTLVPDSWLARPDASEEVVSKSLDFMPVAPTEDEQEKNRRVIAHEAITTLEYLVGEIEGLGEIYHHTAHYQGSWPENRMLLAQERRYSKAYRLTERAFQAAGAVDESAGTRHLSKRTPVILVAIGSAIRELNAAMGEES